MYLLFSLANLWWGDTIISVCFLAESCNTPSRNSGYYWVPVGRGPGRGIDLCWRSESDRRGRRGFPGPSRSRSTGGCAGSQSRTGSSGLFTGTLCHVAKILYEYKQQNSIVVYVLMFREAKEDISGNDEVCILSKVWQIMNGVRKHFRITHAKSDPAMSSYLDGEGDGNCCF